MAQMRVIEFRAVLLGALSLLAGYLLWAVAASVLASLLGMSVPAGAWFFLSLIGALGPIAAGYVGARVAHSHRLLHGAIAAVVGAAIVLAALSAFMGFSGIYGTLGALIASAVLSLVGSLFAAHRPAQVVP
jgi:hypothetical protein